MIAETRAKLFNTLVQMSPEQLAHYVQNPIPGGPPPYLALAALQEQEGMKQAASSPPSGQPSVAQQVLQKAVPPPSSETLGPPQLAAMQNPPAPAPIDQGIAALPTEEPRYEQGGIVSFAGNTDGSYVNSDWIYGKKSADEDALATLFAANQPGEEETEEERRLRAIRELRRAEIPYGERERMQKAYDLFQSPEMTPEEMRTAFGAAVPARTPYGTDMTPHGESSIDKRFTVTPSGEPESEKFDFLKTLDDIRGKLGSSGDGVGVGTTRNYDTLFPDLSLEKKRKQTAEEVLAETEGLEKKAGLTDIYGELEGRLKTKEERALKERDQDRWAALAQAGFTMAATPGSFGTALAKGAQAGLGAFGEANKTYRSAQDKIDESNQLLALSRHQEKAGKIKDAAATARASEDAYVEAVNRERVANAEIARARVTAQQNDEQRMTTLQAARMGQEGALARTILSGEYANSRSAQMMKAREEMFITGLQQKMAAASAVERDRYAKMVQNWIKTNGDALGTKFDAALRAQGRKPTPESEQEKLAAIQRAALAAVAKTIPDIISGANLMSGTGIMSGYPGANATLIDDEDT